MEIQLVLDAGAVLAETPIWDERIKKLYWTDLFEGEVHQFDPSTKIDICVKTNGLIGSAIPCESLGKVIAVVDTGIYVVDMDTGEMKLIVNPEPNRDENRYNDARCDARGRIFISSVSKLYGSDDYKPDMLGAFYMVDTDNTVTKLVDGINQYNGIVFDKKNENMYVVDTFNQKIIRFPYSPEQGVTGKGEEVISFSEMPDGLSIDSEDNLYVCHWAGKITVWSTKDYTLIKTIDFPCSNVCCGGFAGSDKKDFYVATSRFSQSDEHPDIKAGAGGIFKLRNEIEGRFDYFYHI